MPLTAEARRQRALDEVEAHRPTGRQAVATLEIAHPSLAQPVRVVADNADLVARLEDDQVVTFTALAFQAAPPAQLESRWPEIELRLDAAANLIEPHLEATLASDAPVTLVFREFVREIADEGPSRVIAGLELDRSQAGDLVITGVAGFYGLDRKFGTTYEPDRYPGIV